MSSKYMLQILVAVDQLGNAMLGGWADETLSSRAYRQRHKTRWTIAMNVIDTIFFWQDSHCYLAYLAEVERRQTFPEDRVAHE
jgi:hypothetical protein